MKIKKWIKYITFLKVFWHFQEAIGVRYVNKISKEKMQIKNRLIVIKLKNLYPDDPVDRLRGINVVNALQKRGWNIHLFNNQKNIDVIIYLDDYNLYDRLVYEYIKAQKVVIDIQDNHLNRHNPASQFIKSTQQSSRSERIITELKKGILPFIYKIIVKKMWYKLYLDAIKRADYLLCSSHALTESYKTLNAKVMTIPDALTDVSLKRNVTKNECLSICWIGTENNIVYLKLVEEAIAQLQQHYKVDFYIITSHNILNDHRLSEMLKSFRFTYRFTEWKNETVADELQKHHIAIAPLPEMTEKSTNKILTYMAADLPVVASGAQDYERLHTDYPDSFLYLDNNRTQEWVNALESLLDDTAKRDALVKKAQQVINDHNINTIATTYEQLFMELFNGDDR